MTEQDFRETATIYEQNRREALKEQDFKAVAMWATKKEELEVEWYSSPEYTSQMEELFRL